MLCNVCSECDLLGSAAVAYGQAIDDGKEEAAIEAAGLLYASLLCPECYSQSMEPAEHCCECGGDLEEGEPIRDCDHVYHDGEPCLGTICALDDGTIECDTCYVVSSQVVIRGDELLVTLHSQAGDKVIDFSTNNQNEN